ncbi:gametocyte-specific factor 1 [Synchiropus splendidus]|uniref:gametocyte-specific factor 1 n=1 Tax=Synchiropus splendidus TaxID=270530 RepID=UPI00237D7E22|nr:gametocyte-specific factor 1 [Synchiropus splendidus]XP_053704996.1 gametocyte-specific factor 1 [Synchiropus splendidus]
MATIRFGSSLGASSNSSGERAQLAEQFDDSANLDPERLLLCPYDPNHLIRACRFPYHLIKCRKNHPKLAKELKTCPYNARHLVKPQDFAHHMETCVDRVRADTPVMDESCRFSNPPSTWVNPSPTEDWEAEADNGAAPFIWKKSSTSAPMAASNPSEHLGQHIRAPNTLPW